MEQLGYVWFAVWTVFALICSSASGQNGHYRLPNDTRPERYDVSLTVDLDEYRFSGTVRISLVAQTETNNVTLNVKELDLLKVTLTDQTGKNFVLVGSVMQNDSEKVMFNFDSYLSVGSSYQMVIQFAGSITDDLKGLYRSSYYSGTEERFVATTFNAAAYARKIFPCYDEPEYKAKFKLEIFHKPQYHALSNMPVESRNEQASAENLSRTIFAESPPMSSYLFAFVVSDFSALQLDETFGAYAQPSVINSTEYALGFTKDAIVYLGRFFKRPYQLSKLDIIAVDDFLMGAMENWGLITYKTSRIVYRKGLDKTEKLQSVTKIVFHELIHQWFGNEVTCAWWSYVWLNEGFTVFLESYILSQMHPEWQLMDQFLVNEMHPVMERDILPETRAMTKPINSPDQIAAIYDFVVYPKAASIVRMIHSIVGSAVFDEFLVEYLSDRSFNSSTEGDMVRVLQDTVNRHSIKLPSIETVVKSWTNNPSYPVVTVNRDQEGSVSINAVPAKTFYIPLNWLSRTNKSGIDWLPSSEGSIRISLKDVRSDEWILVNPHQYSYFRVNYDAENWRILTRALNQDHQQIPMLSRAQLIDDALALVKDYRLEVEVLLEHLNYLPHETDLIPLKAGFKVFRYLNRMLRGNDLFLRYSNHLTELLEKVYSRMLQNTKDDHVSKLYRTEVRKIACELGVPSCLHDAIGLFDGFELIDPDLRAAVICGAMKGSESYNIWAITLRRMVYIVRNFEQKRINLEEFEDILYGFGCALSHDRLESYFLLSLSTTETLEPSDRIKMFNYIANSGVNGTNQALNWLINDFNTIKRRYGSVDEIISNLRYAVSTPEQLQSFVKLMQKNTDPALKMLLMEVYEEVGKNVRWVEEKFPLIDKWISTSSGADVSGTVPKTLLIGGFFISFYCLMH